MTPANYAPFITTVETTIGAVMLEVDAQVNWKSWVKEDPMTGGEVKSYGWIGMTPKPKPWFGSRMGYQAAPQTYQVNVVPYELTLYIDKFTLMDSDPNAMSIFWAQLPMMARQWRRHPEYEIRDFLETAGLYSSATKQAGLDTKPFFGTHPINFYNPTFNNGSLRFASGSYYNDFIGGVTPYVGSPVIGGPFGIVSFTTLRAYMRSIPFEDGETAGIIPNTLMTHTDLETEVDFVFKATMLAPPIWGGIVPLTGQVGAADNQLAKLGMKLILNPFLRYTTRWYMMDTSYSEKAVKWVVREAPKTVPRISESDPIVWDSHRYAWGGYDRVAPAWGYSWLMARSG